MDKNISENYKIKYISNQVEWNNYLMLFEDANIYQMWGYSKIVQDEKRVEYLVIYKNSVLIGLAQVRIRLIPIINRGIAYIFNGPIWQKKGSLNNGETFDDILFLLYENYVIKKKLLFRFKPFIYSDNNLIDKFNYDGLFKKLSKKNNRTLLLGLDKDINIIRNNFKKKWKKSLEKAENNDLEIKNGYDISFQETFLHLYRNMINRKKFKEYVPPENTFKLIPYLPVNFKPRIFIAYKNNIPLASLVGSAVGKIGIALFSATSEEGMKLNASYLLHWHRIKWFKEMGCNMYDLGGIDAIKNPGVYFFKKGISQYEVFDLGLYEGCENFLSKVFVYIAEFFKNIISKF